MFPVHAVDATNRDRYAQFVEQHYRIRHDIYVGERRWMELARPDGRDVDQFDTDDATYLLGIEPGRGVVAGSRLVPTMKPHLMSEVFPELAKVRGLPRAPDVMEWTRIFVVPSRREDGRLCKSAGVMYCAILEFCLAQAIRQLSVVCEAYWIPRFSGLGWNPRSLGLPIERDGMSIVGVTLDVTEAALAQTRAMYAIAPGVLAGGARAPARGKLEAPPLAVLS